MDKEIMKGSIDILLLSVISKKDTYGYEIGKNISEKSSNFYSIGEGTLYPALKRLELRGWLTSYWVDLESGGRRKYYSITETGKKELAVKSDNWKRINRLIEVCTEE